MSTKSTIFLTNDNEHCYSDCSLENYDKDKKYIGDSIILEMSKKNVDLIYNDHEDIIVEIKPGNELYEIISGLKWKI